MRQITRRITDCRNKTYKGLEDKLKRNHVKYDGMLVSIDTGIAYLWDEVKNKRIAPVRS